jgi:methyl acetate hydrolase
MSNLRKDAQGVLDRAVSAPPGLPGVAAVITHREDNVFAGSAGERVLGDGVPMSTDTVCAVFSATKAITGTAVLQLVEDGRLDLDAPAKRYLPALGDVRVLEGFDAEGAPRLRPPKGDITTRMLLLHTAGFGYDFFNESYLRLRKRGQPGIVGATRASLQTPLLFDPGERWEYGTSVDWAGLVVEAIAEQRLGDFMEERIFGPLGMTSTAFTLTRSMRERLARVHRRKADGHLEPMRNYELPPDPEVHMGGHGLYSTPEDYAKFIRMWLNDGRGPSGEFLLRRETVAMAAESGLGDLTVRPLTTADPKITHDVDFFPGMPKSWGLTFMINEAPAPTGRPAGALAWAGLANVYYWVDRENGIGGFWASQLFPFADPAAWSGYLELETTAYRHLAPPTRSEG